MSEQVFQQAIDNRLQCGLTTRSGLEQNGQIAPNVYLWRVGGSGRMTLVENVMPHHDVADVVLYREIRSTIGTNDDSKGEGYSDDH